MSCYRHQTNKSNFHASILWYDVCPIKIDLPMIMPMVLRFVVIKCRPILSLKAYFSVTGVVNYFNVK